MAITEIAKVNLRKLTFQVFSAYQFFIFFVGDFPQRRRRLSTQTTSNHDSIVVDYDVNNDHDEISCYLASKTVASR